MAAKCLTHAFEWVSVAMGYDGEEEGRTPLRARALSGATRFVLVLTGGQSLVPSRATMPSLAGCSVRLALPERS